MQTTGTTSRAEEVIARCKRVASFTEDPDGTRRTFLSPPMRDCHGEISRWMEPLGVHAQLDAAGNIRGIYPAAAPNARLVTLGPRVLRTETAPVAAAAVVLHLLGDMR